MSEEIHFIDLGKSYTFLPELPRDEAERISKNLIAQGCLRCGATTNQGIEAWTENGEKVTAWTPIKNTETCEEGACCAVCYLIIRASRKAAER